MAEPLNPSVVKTLSVLMVVLQTQSIRVDAGEPQPADRLPNLALICCNNLGCGDVDCFGSKKHRTPHKAAEWIWTNEERQQIVSARFTKRFEIDRPLSSARLQAAADFNRMTVLLNGRPAAKVADYGPWVSIDVSQQLIRGDNLLEVRSDNSAGPAAIAIAINVIFDDGTQTSIVSDTTWQTYVANIGEAPNFQHAVSFGKVTEELWRHPKQTAVGIDEVDDYTQWKQALTSDQGSDPSTFLVPDGFQIELLRSARKSEGSWISLAFDPKGRLVIAREDKGLLRLSLPENDADSLRLESINDSLLECRGLLFAFGALFVNANNSKGFYRLRDTNGDDHYDEVKLLHRSEGSVGHGRNCLTIGPDNLIYLIHGDAVELPTDCLDRTSPFREHHPGINTRQGHVIRTDRDGKRWELLASGLRNPYGIDFNSDGEMFTYDADAEHDMGAPWYRPTRVDHLVSGGDFGWRGVTDSWPAYYPDHPDNALPNLDIGKGSPTGVRFGIASHFPLRYRKALFILDWAYGRIIAIHMMPRGASYVCRGETFIKGRPLNVTNLSFGPDGAMYFVTGGRKTQSGLYRVRYVGPRIAETPQTPQQVARRHHAQQARALRHKLESYHGEQAPDILGAAWPHLNSPDPWIRHAARVAVEHQPTDSWQARALAESHPAAALPALMALARSSQTTLLPRIIKRLNQIPLRRLTVHQQLVALYSYSLCCLKKDNLNAELLTETIERLSPVYPVRSIIATAAALKKLDNYNRPVWQVHLTDTRQPTQTPSAARQLNRLLSELLIHLNAPGAVSRTLELLRESTNQKDQLHYLYVLRNARREWTLEQRRAYFEALQQSRYFQGGAGMPKFINRIHDDAVATLSDTEREQLDDVLSEDMDIGTANSPPAVRQPFVRDWSMDDLEQSLEAVGKHRDLQRGENSFRSAGCIQCHRMGTEGRPIGPDLTSVGSRFSRRDILASIILPSQVVAEQYRTDMIVTTQGKVLTGRIVPQNDFRAAELLIATDPLQPWNHVQVAKSQIESHKRTRLSSMPKGLLNTLTKEDILNLLAYVEAAGRKRDRNSRP